MEFSIRTSSPDQVKTGCVVVGVFEGCILSRSAETLDRMGQRRILKVLRDGDLDGKCGKTRLLYHIPGIQAERVLVVGLGARENVNEKSWCESVRAAVNAVMETGASDSCMFLAEIKVRGRDFVWKARQFCLVSSGALYRFNRMKSSNPPLRKLARLALGVSEGNATMAVRGVKQGRAICEGMSFAKELGNLPGNVCTPAYLAEQALKLGNEKRLDVQVFEAKEISKLGMGAFLSVSRGSRQPPKFIVARHNGASQKERPIVLIGKGITFDTGGISLKPGAAMDEMKFDMCGAACVLGTLLAASELRLRLNVVGLIPATENMPDGAATRPGDIVTSMSGQTIEVLNTDAEGRLIMCDALTFAERYQPQVVIDVATLTGACVVALGHICSGVFSNKDYLARELIAAGEESYDRAWQLPLWEDYQEELKSNFADVANVGGRAAGSITAAAFLSRFASKYDWAHLDIAGTAWNSGKAKGATGRPVPLLTSFLLKRARKS